MTRPRTDVMFRVLQWRLGRCALGASAAPVAPRHGLNYAWTGNRGMRRRWLKPTRLLAVAAMLLSIGAVGSAVARADTLSISVQPSSLVWTSEDVTAPNIMSTWPTVTVSGTAAVQYLQVTATVQQSGACGETTDTGYTLIGGQIQQSADGSFTTSAQLDVGDPGPSGPATYLICAWITHQDESKFGPVSDTFVVRRPQASLAFESVSATPG